MARAGIVVGLCPITEANLGDGLFPAGAFLKSGGRFGVGSDSNVRISAAEELRTLDYGQRLLTRRRTPLTPPGASSGRALWEAAVNGGAQALDIGLSGIQPGARADLVMLDSEAIAHHARGGDDLLDALVYAGGGGRAEAVRHVVAHGRLVVVDGRHIAREAIETRFRAALAKALAA